MTYRLRALVIVAAAGWLAPSATADDDVWKTAVSGTWSAGANWVDGSPPNIFDEVAFNLPGAYTVSFSADPDPIHRLTLSGGANVTFASSSRPPSPIVPRTLHLVGTSDGDLSVGNGTLTLGTTTGGFPSTSHPFHLNADHTVGVSGTLNVKFNSDVNAAILDVNGQLNITGTGSSVTTSSFGVLDGAVNVTQGGLVQSGNAGILGAVAVSGAGSRWVSSGGWQVGGITSSDLQSHDGVVTITGGGLVENLTASLGGGNIGGPPFTGSVSVADSGSLWKITDQLELGHFGIGIVNVQPGGTVSVGQETIIKSQGRLRLQGGTFDTGELTIVTSGQFEWTSGTLHVGTYHGDLNNSSGTLAPGHSAGVTTISGDYFQQAGGNLEIEIGGAAQGTQYDVVNVTDAVQLGGQLDLKLISGFVPTPSQSFVILSADGVSGSFSNVGNGQRLTAAGGGSFQVHYGLGSAFDPTLVVLSAFQSGLSGDFDADGDVDGRDFLIWQRGGSPNPNSSADLAAWKANFGFHALTASGTAVPEPSGGWLALAAIVSACAFRPGSHDGA
jgi:T5SS/PEP-CTERM-associated repeat protein